nr:MAG TPA: hypothetical protein [Caudoviricetes sp.]
MKFLNRYIWLRYLLREWYPRALCGGFHCNAHTL